MRLNDLIRAAEEQGFEVRRTKKGHWQFKPPDPNKQIVVLSGTPSDHRSERNALARLRRSGLIYP